MFSYYNVHAAEKRMYIHEDDNDDDNDKNSPQCKKSGRQKVASNNY